MSTPPVRHNLCAAMFWMHAPLIQPAESYYSALFVLRFLLYTKQNMFENLSEKQKTFPQNKKGFFRTFILFSAAFVFAALCLVFTFSCLGTKTQESFSVHAAESLDEINGRWISETGKEYEWPVEINGKRFLRFAYTDTDVTEDFAEYAEKHGIAFSELWEKRFAYLSDIYSLKLEDGKRVSSPYASSNGIETGIILKAVNSEFYDDKIPFRIFYHVERLFPENIAEQNISFFMICSSDSIKENGVFDSFSNEFGIIQADGEIYLRK